MTVPLVPSSCAAQNGFPNLNSKAKALPPFHMNSALLFKRKPEELCLTKIPGAERE